MLVEASTNSANLGRDLTAEVCPLQGGLMDYEFSKSRQELRWRARSAMANWLQLQHWDSFFTVTFKHPQRFPFTAISKTASEFRSDLGLYTPRLFIAAEPHESGMWHTHGLVYGEWFQDTETKKLILATQKANLNRLGWSRIEPIKSVGGATGYVSKYLTKEKDCEYDIFGKWG